MKRLSLTVLCGLALMLVPAAGAGASPAATPTLTVSGSLLDFDGSPLAGGWASWGWYDPDGYSWYCPDAMYHAGGDDTASKDGSFSFSNVTSLPEHDTLMVGGGSSPGLLYAVLYHLDFSKVGDYQVRPGHLGVSVAHAPEGRLAEVGLGDALYVGTQTSVRLKDGAGMADALAPDFNSARVSFPKANGRLTAECEWLSPGLAPIAVGPGTVASSTVDVDWRSAVRGRIAGPTCRHAGRPGSTLTYRVSNLPAGEQLSFLGYSWSPSWGVQKYPQVVTSAGAENVYTVALRVPDRATVGTVYDVDAERSDEIQSMLWLYDYYEVCDLAATRSVISRGDGVRLRGHVDSEKATLFVRHSPAGQPGTVRARGWTRLEGLSASAQGRFITQRLQPSRTTWYVVRFHGGGGFTAFTPVVKVTVR